MTTIHALDLGITSDGSDEWQALAALRDTIRNGPDRPVTIEFEPGLLSYSRNGWWRFGNRDVTLDFGGAQVRCTNAGDWDRGTGPTPPCGPHEFWSEDDPVFLPEPATVPAGFRFRSVQAGSWLVELMEPPGDGDLIPGDVVLLVGLIQQQNGWPYNHRWFELADVVAVDLPFVQFRMPLRHAYDETWTDVAHEPLAGKVRQFGAARLILTRYAGYEMPRSVTIRNARFIANPNKPQHDPALNLVTRRLTLENVITDGSAVVAMGDLFEARHCRFAEFDLDKQARRVRLDTCVVEGFFGGHSGGCEELELRDCDINSMTSAQHTSTRFLGYNRVWENATLANGASSLPGPVVL
jgi:hypothetical protein